MRLLLGAVLLVASGCANPVPPSGGPKDQQPPRIAASRPEAEATEVPTDRTVDIQFSEYVDRSSLREALSVTPRPEGRLEFDWSQRSVEITFPRPFRDSTTYLLTIDKALQDVRESTALEQPITLAFSTGDEIDQGTLAGRVVGSARGAGREGLDVYAYRAGTADSARLPRRPLYRTQTGPEGRFQFAYLREEARYYVVALRDRNRNRRPDPLEGFAVPPDPSLPARAAADSLAGAPPDSIRAGGRGAPSAQPSEEPPWSEDPPWVAGRKDAVPPRLTRALPLSRKRLALRFSEPIRLRSRASGRFTLIDTTTGQSVAVRRVYRRPGQQQRLTLRTAPMRPGAGYRARLPAEGSGVPALTDTSGNAPERPAAAPFTASDRPDTLGLRFRGFTKKGPSYAASGQEGAPGLSPGQSAAVQFNQPLAADSAATRQLLTARDTTTGAALRYRLATENGTTYRLRFVPPLDSGQVARLRVRGRRLRPPFDTTYTRLVRRLPSSALGAVSGTVQIAPDSLPANTTAAPVLVELFPAERPGGDPLRTTRADSSGTFIFKKLPEAAYRFRAFLDRDTDGTWDPGQLAPYRPAEPLTWSRSVAEARPRWETATEDTLRIVNRQL